VKSKRGGGFMKITRFVNNRKINEEELAKITIDNERIRNIIKTVEKRIN
jgi:hypothetical protein